jgi:fimbrial chaperone protein
MSRPDVLPRLRHGSGFPQASLTTISGKLAMPFSMRAIMRSVVSAGAALVALAGPALSSAALQASPVLIEISDRSPSAVITIRNTSQDPIDVQTRVMRWTQANGAESLEEAEEIIASPPMTTLRPGSNYAVRIVRSAKGQVSGEEAYRVFVDQLPDATRQKNGTVALVVRHSIPVFLGDGDGGQPKVTWKLGSANGKLTLQATNNGTRRLRLANVAVRLADGRRVTFGSGLLGYVLAGSTMEWRSNAAVTSGPGTVTAVTDLGPLTAEAHGLR